MYRIWAETVEQLREAEQRGLIPECSTRSQTWTADDYRVHADLMFDAGLDRAEEHFRKLVDWTPETRKRSVLS